VVADGGGVAGVVEKRRNVGMGVWGMKVGKCGDGGELTIVSGRRGGGEDECKWKTEWGVEENEVEVAVGRRRWLG